MGTNVVRFRSTELEASLIAQGRGSQERDVLRLLSGQWREQVMGAWLALFHRREPVTTALLIALSKSAGSLTSPPLITCAVLMAGQGAESTLRGYLANDRRHAWGGAEFAEVALIDLGLEQAQAAPPTPAHAQANEDYGQMFQFAKAVAKTTDSTQM